jgi:hypothetical protein
MVINCEKELFEFNPWYQFVRFDVLFQPCWALLKNLSDLIPAESNQRKRNPPLEIPVQVVIPFLMLALVLFLDLIAQIIKLVMQVLELPSLLQTILSEASIVIPLRLFHNVKVYSLNLVFFSA